jgi:hypothetical protein
VDTIQATLGEAVLVLVSLVVVLLAVILLLVEADYVLRLVEKLVRRLKSDGAGRNRSGSPTID